MFGSTRDRSRRSFAPFPSQWRNTIGTGITLKGFIEISDTEKSKATEEEDKEVQEMRRFSASGSCSSKGTIQGRAKQEEDIHFNVSVLLVLLFCCCDEYKDQKNPGRKDLFGFYLQVIAHY